MINAIDFSYLLTWWLLLLIIGISFLPTTLLLFPKFFDRGYIFSKSIGIIFLTYTVFLFGTLHMLPFTRINTTVLFLALFVANAMVFVFNKQKLLAELKEKAAIFFCEEVLFIGAFIFWAFIRMHAPDAHGIEKYMDFGFVNSILRTSFFPAKDIWFANFPINYYYFGHTAIAVLTRFSGINASVTFNLMFATIFALIFSSAFSIGYNLLSFLKKKTGIAIAGGLLTALLTTLSGNLQTIYAFFSSYQNDSAVPFWQLIFKWQSYPNSYWYPNATRFIYHTIHEFPAYALIVSDLHGHLLDTPFVLLMIAVLFSLFSEQKIIGNLKLDIGNWIFLSFLLAVLYMTNAWDGIIYFLLTVIVLLFVINKAKEGNNQEKSIQYKVFSIKFNKYRIPYTAYCILILLCGFFLFSLPFNFFFKPFASQIGVMCMPDFLINIGHIGPILFEKDHCVISPFWQLGLLYGFFYFWIIPFLFITFRKLNARRYMLDASDLFVVFLIGLSTMLILTPEIVYLKDIYTTYFRANTMFKLSYESFIMLSIATGYIIIKLISNIKFPISNFKFKILNFWWKLFAICYTLFAICLLFLVFSYPFLGIISYYNGLKINYGLNGTNYLKSSYPSDYNAIQWLNEKVSEQPIILEAQGDEYGDYSRISANTGLPTVIGWGTHEWLWRSTYDVVGPRITDVKTIYETSDPEIAKTLLKKYNVTYIFLGDLEHQKYPNLNEQKFSKIGKLVFQNGNTKIYQVNK